MLPKIIKHTNYPHNESVVNSRGGKHIRRERMFKNKSRWVKDEVITRAYEYLTKGVGEGSSIRTQQNT